ncbi:hypothetical protein BpHYR1_011217 [Brachionus plicatilis]|uniref:Uncharacterized protein n=1 Tax=Brachionus plicatilis TaxID=10195 RepID=A0A3M7SN84_BRAPC|nr:hypothetical protein BpHYR1_011217 [Brachionus plicatilis]
MLSQGRLDSHYMKFANRKDLNLGFDFWRDSLKKFQFPPSGPGGDHRRLLNSNSNKYGYLFFFHQNFLSHH